MLKMPNGALVADDEESAELVRSMKVGQPVRCTLVKVRNYEYHKKFFSLVKFAFDIWSDTMPQMEYRGQPVQPNLARFRKDLTIMAGYFSPVFCANGEVRLEAKSISFASMAQCEFEALFSATINAVLQKILAGTRLTEAQLRAHVDRVMAYD